MILGLGLHGVSQLFIPLASGPTLASALLLLAQQLGDGAYMLYEVNQVSLRQMVTSERLLGRINGTLQFVSLVATLAGSMLGGLLGELLGVRVVLLFGACCTLVAALLLLASPVRRFALPLIRV